EIAALITGPFCRLSQPLSHSATPLRDRKHGKASCPGKLFSITQDAPSALMPRGASSAPWTQPRTRLKWCILERRPSAWRRPRPPASSRCPPSSSTAPCTTSITARISRPCAGDLFGYASSPEARPLGGRPPSRQAARLFLSDGDGMTSDLATRALDPQLAQALMLERQRQQDSIELIASENIVSAAVRQAQGSVLTNKYAEGYPGRRYYGGCEAVDIAEKLAIERACTLFDTAYANVQPHSGVNANLAVLFALIKPGDRIMGLDLACGGHLTHGSPVSLSGQWFEVSAYRVREDDDLIDYNDMEQRVLQDRPRLIYAGGSAYPRRIDFARMRQIADRVGAWLVADVAHYAGLIAAGLYPNPTPHAHVTTSTTHKTLRGPRGGLVLCNDPELARRIDKAVFPGTQGGPLMHVIAGKAAAFHEAQQPSFVDYSRAVIENARVLGGTVAGGGLR